MRSPGIKVPVAEAETALKQIIRERAINKNLRSFSDENYVYFPLSRNIYINNGVNGEFDFDLKNITGIREILKNTMGRDGEKIGWQRIGDALIFNHNTNIPEKACELLNERLGFRQIYEIQGPVIGESRKPEIKILYGEPHDTKYRENGVTFVLNPNKVMLSKGNIVERGIPYSKLISPREVLDMFSGIGYFSLPLGKRFPIVSMTCVDINSTALEYLKKSYQETGLKFPLNLINSDCRNINTDKKFDTIIMGNFKSVNYLPQALSHGKEEFNLIIHHIESSDTIQTADYELMKKCVNLGYLASVIDTHIVKSYAPHMWHLSTLIFLRRKF
ncbi:class I SAM-dependent methyltransferase [Cuniculiplasma sp. SKW4]|uniref:class I SAM-dependent methyltransferase n=1 Tax=Cuniculiplasma sp. SKW4 TaxID=3400171 RepID=UPI003FD62FC9